MDTLLHYSHMDEEDQLELMGLKHNPSEEEKRVGWFWEWDNYVKRYHITISSYKA